MLNFFTATGVVGRGRQALTVLVVVGLLLAPQVAPGTVEEQRARLPPPAVCEDPVTGVWKSHAYDAYFGDWTEFELEIYHIEGSETGLTGMIRNHTWYGDPTDEQPGMCMGQLHYNVSMPARGTIIEGQIAFGGVGQWRLEEVLCGRWTGRYNLDNFTGHIDADLQEFQSVNNDGGRAVNDPTVFRRIRCHEPPPPTEIHVETPAFFPTRTRESAGCG